ncbi:MAG: hypothetical protein P8163_22560 [Candidatus Thiodiazotropha sp.]
MKRLILTSKNYFYSGRVAGLGESYNIDTTIGEKAAMEACSLYKHNKRLLYIDSSHLQYESLRLRAGVREWLSHIKGVFRYSNDSFDIRCILRPPILNPFSSKPSYLTGYINGKRIFVARANNTIYDTFRRATLTVMFRENVFPGCDDDDLSAAIAVVAWWILYESDN